MSERKKNSRHSNAQRQLHTKWERETLQRFQLFSWNKNKNAEAETGDEIRMHTASILNRQEDYVHPWSSSFFFPHSHFNAFFQICFIFSHFQLQNLQRARTLTHTQRDVRITLNDLMRCFHLANANVIKRTNYTKTHDYTWKQCEHDNDRRRERKSERGKRRREEEKKTNNLKLKMKINTFIHIFVVATPFRRSHSLPLLIFRRHTRCASHFILLSFNALKTHMNLETDSYCRYNLTRLFSPVSFFRCYWMESRDQSHFKRWRAKKKIPILSVEVHLISLLRTTEHQYET